MRAWRSPAARAALIGAGIVVVALILAAVACNAPKLGGGDTTAQVITTRPPIATWTPPASLTPADELTSTPLAGPLPTSGPTITPRATVEPTLAPSTPCADAACAVAAQHFWLARPIPSGEGFVDYVDRSYPYGSTQNDAREPHHGVEFFNGSGTPIIAAAAGTVQVAGNDDFLAFGPSTRFYGNLVVVQLDQTYDGQPVFNLYGHMQSVNVRVGDHVQVGDDLGLVGSTGVAIGPHLHFEVRVGENLYTATRNPELWLTPYTVDGTPYGAIAGRVIDTNGNVLNEITVAIRPVTTVADAPRNRFVLTYAADVNHINGDDRLGENFGIGDMPPGLYAVSVSTTKLYQQTLTVKPGELAFITFVVNPPQPRPTAGPETETPPAPTDAPTVDATAAELTAVALTLTPAATITP